MKFRDFLPLVALIDLETNFLEKFSSIALFWSIIYLLLKNIDIWPLLGICDLKWPHVTSRGESSTRPVHNHLTI